MNTFFMRDITANLWFKIQKPYSKWICKIPIKKSQCKDRVLGVNNIFLISSSNEKEGKNMCLLYYILMCVEFHKNVCFYTKFNEKLITV
jgi:hypothetical protein